MPEKNDFFIVQLIDSKSITNNLYNIFVLDNLLSEDVDLRLWISFIIFRDCCRIGRGDY